MNWRAIFAIVRKDLQVVSQNKGVLLPITIVPLVLFVILPWLTALAPALVNVAGISFSQLDELITRMPPGLQQELAGYDMSQKVIVFFLVYMLAPLFLIIPLMVASVIAADSFAGEKERKTMEALLYTPMTDRELFVAKLLSAWLAAVAVALVGFVLYSVMANAAAWPLMRHVFFPNAMWLALVIWVVPAVAGLGLGVMVLVSARAQGFQDAYQLGSVVVVPVLLLVFGQISGVMYFSVTLVLVLGLVIWLLNSLLVWLGSRSFRRERLLVS
jgi:ABC-2 type transport system permease protein